MEKLTLGEVETKLSSILNPMNIREDIIGVLSEFFDIEIKRQHK